MTAVNMHDGIFDPIRQFQFHQDTPGKAEFRYVKKRPLTAEEMNYLREGLKIKLGDDVELALKEVREIPRSPSGKLHFLEQHLAVRYMNR